MPRFVPLPAYCSKQVSRKSLGARCVNKTSLQFCFAAHLTIIIGGFISTYRVGKSIVMTPVVDSPVQVHLFGQFELLQGDSSSSLPPASAARSLLAYLLLHKGRLFPRSVLADLIAPDLSEAQARHALSQALWHIRRSLPGLLESDASQIASRSRCGWMP